MSKRKINRSTVSGKFVNRATVLESPDTTVTESVSSLHRVVREMLATADIPEEWRQKLEKAVGQNIAPASAEGGDDLGLEPIRVLADGREMVAEVKDGSIPLYGDETEIKL
jgi:hypothetical protein